MFLINYMVLALPTLRISTNLNISCKRICFQFVALIVSALHKCLLKLSDYSNLKFTEKQLWLG